MQSIARNKKTIQYSIWRSDFQFIPLMNSFRILLVVILCVCMPSVPCMRTYSLAVRCVLDNWYICSLSITVCSQFFGPLTSLYNSIIRIEWLFCMCSWLNCIYQWQAIFFFSLAYVVQFVVVVISVQAVIANTHLFRRKVPSGHLYLFEQIAMRCRTHAHNILRTERWKRKRKKANNWFVCGLSSGWLKHERHVLNRWHFYQRNRPISKLISFMHQ